MSFEYDESLAQEFIQEALESVQEAEQALLKMNEEISFKANFDKVFRIFHSVKGGAGMFGWNELQSVVHHFETLLTRNKAKGSFSPETLDYFLLGLDAVQSLLQGQPINFELYDPDQKSTQDKNSTGTSHAQRRKQKEPRAELVYVVDDEPDLVEIITDLVDENGYATRGFTSPKELLRTLSEERADQGPVAVLADIIMPEMNGIELLGKIHEINPELPVIFISGQITKDTCIEGLRLGAEDFVEKPINEVQLQNTLNNCVQRYTLHRLIKRSIKFMLYQYPEMDAFLKAHGKNDLRATFKQELEGLVKKLAEMKGLKAETKKAA